jgi:hypothetical protein
MTGTLKHAVQSLVERAQAECSLLRVSEAADKLAAEHGCDTQAVAELITRAGVAARVNMELGGTKSAHAGLEQDPRPAG